MPRKLYVVTGGAGFIGSNLVAALARQDHDVVVCDWMRSDDRWRNLAKHEIADLVLPQDLHTWLAAHKGQVDGIVHMGAISATTELDVDLITANNIRMTMDLLQWCTDHGTPLIYASSAATYGDGGAGFDDDFSCDALARLRPLNAYGWSKHIIDRRIARLAQQGAALPPQWAGLKFFNVYGPNEYHKGSMKSVVAQNYARVETGEPLKLFRSYRKEYKDGGQLRDFIYVRDCVDTVMWLLDNQHVSGLFNLGTGKARSWLDLANALFMAAGREKNIQFIDMPTELINKYQYFTEARMDKLRNAGFNKELTSLEDGIFDYVTRYLATEDPYH